MHGRGSINELCRRWTPSIAEYHAPDPFHGPWSFSAGALARVASEGLGPYLARDPESLEARVETDVALNTGTLIHEMIQGLTPTVYAAPESIEAQRKRRNLRAAAAQAAAAGYAAVLLERDVRLAAAMLESLRLSNTPAKRAIMALTQAVPRWPETSHKWEVAPEVWAKVRPDLITLQTERPISIAIKTTARPLADAEWWRGFRRWWLWSAAFHLRGVADLFGQPVPLVFVTGRREYPFPWRVDFLSNSGYGAEFCRGPDARAMIESAWSTEISPLFETIERQKRKGAFYGPEETVRP